VCKEEKTISQKKKRLEEERLLTADKEVKKLLQASFVQEVQYTTWLENMVFVNKNNGKWCMSTDYTNLNKPTPKNPTI